MWLEEDSELDLETVVARLELLLSTFDRLSLVDLLASRLEELEEDLLALKEAFAALLVLIEADLSDDLEAEAFSAEDVLADLDAAASSELEFVADWAAEASSVLDLLAD